MPESLSRRRAWKFEILFEPNRGQTASEIRYLARTGEGAVFVTDEGVTMSVAKQASVVLQLTGMDSPGGWTPRDATGQTISYELSCIWWG